jgi:hypothetical protein
MNYQPGLNIANANPWGGGAYLNIVTSYTNASHGYLVGTNADGVPIYMPQWGLQVFPVSDAYSMDGTAAGAEAQQAPSYVLDLLNDWGLVSYISINGRRAGDIYNGQVPLLAIDPTTSSHIKFRVPLQVSNVWITSNPNWKDAFVVDENTGAASFGGTITGNGSGLTNLSANAIADGLTTNFAVLVPGGGTNTLCFTNGILRAVQ